MPACCSGTNIKHSAGALKLHAAGIGHNMISSHGIYIHRVDLSLCSHGCGAPHQKPQLPILMAWV